MEKKTLTLKIAGYYMKTKYQLTIVAFLQFLHFAMQSDQNSWILDNAVNDQSSYNNSSGDYDEMRWEIKSFLNFAHLVSQNLTNCECT